jgi:hypothetical protein
MMPTFASTRRAHRKDPAKQAAAPGFLKSGFDAAAEIARVCPPLQATDGRRQIARGVNLVEDPPRVRMPDRIPVTKPARGSEQASGMSGMYGLQVPEPSGNTGR